jgi:hypothetical protein
MDFDKTHRDPRLIEPKEKPNTTTQRILKKFVVLSFYYLKNSCQGSTIIK